MIDIGEISKLRWAASHWAREKDSGSPAGGPPVLAT